MYLHYLLPFLFFILILRHLIFFQFTIYQQLKEELDAARAQHALQIDQLTARHEKTMSEFNSYLLSPRFVWLACHYLFHLTADLVREHCTREQRASQEFEGAKNALSSQVFAYTSYS